MPRNNEREQRVIRIMEKQRTRIGYVDQIAAALRDAGADGEEAIRMLARTIARRYAIDQKPGDCAKMIEIERHLDGRAYDGADPADILAALAQLLHERTAVRIADAYDITHAPTTYGPGEERLIAAPTFASGKVSAYRVDSILSAAEASEQAAQRGIAYAADLED